MIKLAFLPLALALAWQPAAAQTRPPSDKAQQVEDEFWKRVDGGDIADYEAYLAAYPEGAMASWRATSCAG